MIIDGFKHPGRNNKQVVYSHIVFWLLFYSFVALEYSLFQSDRGFINIAARLFCTFLIDLLAAYFTVYYLIPHFLLKKKYVWFAAGLVVSATAFVFLQRVVIYYVSYPIFWPEQIEGKGFMDFYPLYAFLNIYTGTALFASFVLTRLWFINQKQKKELENQNKESELALLRSQISPHFLFNTLNNIDSLIFLNQKWASDAVIKLSEILRYMLYEANTDRVPLSTEVSYLKSYVKLQLLRIEQDDFVKFNVKGRVSNHEVAPMLLVPFVENAFKHGKKNVPSPGIEIHIEVTNEEIYFEIRNHMHTDKEVNKEDTSGIGLANVKRRLNLIYPGKHDLKIESDLDLFLVKLKIQNL